MVSPALNANGHRRRELRKRVIAEEHTCALCGGAVNKALTHLPGSHGPKCRGGTCTGCTPHPKRAEVDEDIPRSRGGSPLDRSNTRLMHRDCNQWKGALTLREALTKRGALPAPREARPAVTSSAIW